MEIRVDRGACERYGHCCFEAPGLFELDDDGELVHAPSAPPDRAADVVAAVRACPVQAISVAGP
jgi:ferredoxin